MKRHVTRIRGSPIGLGPSVRRRSTLALDVIAGSRERRGREGGEKGENEIDKRRARLTKETNVELSNATVLRCKLKPEDGEHIKLIGQE